MVSHEINQVANELRVESVDLAAKLRSEADERQVVTHRELESATSDAAKAVAMVDDLRMELNHDQGGAVACLKCEELKPIWLEMRESLAIRDERFRALQEVVSSNPTRSGDPQVTANAKAVEDMQSKLRLMERKLKMLLKG